MEKWNVVMSGYWDEGKGYLFYFIFEFLEFLSCYFNLNISEGILLKMIDFVISKSND